MTHRGAAFAAVCAAMLLLAGCQSAEAPESQVTDPPPTYDASSDVLTPVTGEVQDAPVAAPATDGQTHLGYELRLTNVLSQEVKLDSLTISAQGSQLLELAGQDLADRVRQSDASLGSPVLPAESFANVIVDVPVADGEPPSALEQELTISVADEQPPLLVSPMTFALPDAPVSEAEPIKIGAPLRGDGWLNGNSCCEVTPHRLAINPINGAFHVPERYAIDFVQLDENGRVFDGPVDDLSSYAFEGADIVAVADGPVVALTSDRAEQVPGENPTGLTLDEFGGNYVVQSIGDGQFAFYAHMQPGNPLGLEIGQQLSQGDVIGRLGNSGNSDLPHLHFHVMDSPSPLASNGLPFVIDEFAFAGRAEEQSMLRCMEESIQCDVDDANAGERSAESPLYRDVLDFGA